MHRTVAKSLCWKLHDPLLNRPCSPRSCKSCYDLGCLNGEVPQVWPRPRPPGGFGNASVVDDVVDVVASSGKPGAIKYVVFGIPVRASSTSPDKRMIVRIARRGLAHVRVAYKSLLHITLHFHGDVRGAIQCYDIGQYFMLLDPQHAVIEV